MDARVEPAHDNGTLGGLSRAFGGSPETWLKLQLQYDLAQALRNEAALEVRPVRRFQAA